MTLTFLNHKSYLKPVLVLAFFVALLFLTPRQTLSENFDDEDIYFSYDRFYLKAGTPKDAPKDGRIQNDISAFLENFSDGIYAISEGDFEKAKLKLLKARSIWPEYFGTDFLLASEKLLLY